QRTLVYTNGHLPKKDAPVMEIWHTLHYVHTHTHTNINTHTQTLTHTHTHTHIEKHTQSGQREDASQSSRLGTDYFYIQITVQEINLDTKHVLLYMSSVI